MPLRALMGFGRDDEITEQQRAICLNALTGIDGIWTLGYLIVGLETGQVLMPLRALMGFGPRLLPLISASLTMS